MGEALLIFVIVWLLVVGTGWLIVIPWLRRGPERRADTGALWRLVRLLARFIHRTEFVGLEHLPTNDDAHDGLVVVANHTGAIDPLLIQAPARFWIRWLMAGDMMGDGLGWLWEHQRLIAVDRDNPDMASLREAIRHVKTGGAIGIFPEGRITTPPRELRPFLPGVGLLISRTKAPVLVAWVSGTPDTNNMRDSLLTRSRARVEFLGMYEFDGMKPEAIAERLREILHEHTGWPYNDEVLPPGGPQPD